MTEMQVGDSIVPILGNEGGTDLLSTEVKSQEDLKAKIAAIQDNMTAAVDPHAIDSQKLYISQVSRENALRYALQFLSTAKPVGEVSVDDVVVDAEVFLRFLNP